VTSLPNRFYHWVRHPSAHSPAGEEQTIAGFGHLRGHKYCLLVTYKRSGEAVPTPVWFGLGDGKLYVRSEAAVAKVKRIRNDPHVRIAPCGCIADERTSSRRLPVSTPPIV
jgi:PPOX class probable F420-dependent enzyme